ncbi:hypothetical protein P4C99_03095 [Pontiellaceae bacterium B1224]|nr:hypothetical protein [Pontiellaceae bacterium B1224]
MIRKLLKICYVLALVGLLSTGCSTVNETKMRELNRMADNAVAKIVFEQPGVQAELGAAAGSAVFEWSNSGVPMIGKHGEGVLIDPSSNERAPVRITNLEINGAHGVPAYTCLMLIQDAELFQRAKTAGLSLENAGTLYIYVKGEPSASYAVKRITIEPKLH